MKIQSILSILTVLITFYSCNQSQQQTNAFILKGKVIGPKTKYLILGYHDSYNVYVMDTIPLNNNSFSTQGHLINTQIVSLTSNLAGRSTEDPNNLRFFLEPGKIDVTLKEGEFSKAQIRGSKTQLENENLKKSIKPFYENIEQLVSRRKTLINSSKKEHETEILESKINQINDAIEKELDGIKNVKLNYVENNPRSYLSADIISFYANSLPNDSLVNLYNRLGSILKASSYGIEIKAQLDIVDVGDVAPDFSYEDLNGNILSLNQFKGKIVLLDFGAAWCVPCKDEIPEVKRIYEKYHPHGLEIIGVSFDKDKQSWRENVQNENLNWHHIYEGFHKQERESAISNMYSVRPIPAYILIDGKGVIIDRYRNADNEDKNLNDLEEKLNKILTSK